MHRITRNLIRQIATQHRQPASATAAYASRQQRPLCTKSEQEQLAQIRAGVAPATGASLREMAARVWGHTSHPAGAGQRSGQKILRRALKGPLYVGWYPQLPLEPQHRTIKLTEKQERWQKKLKILRAAGKGPPKKGAGKRSK